MNLAINGAEGCSTLDLMKRLEEPKCTSSEILMEMKHILQADKEHRQLQRVQRGDALIADITKLGDVEEARNKLRAVFIPDKPLSRTLQGGRFLGPEDKRKLLTSLVRPLSSDSIRKKTTNRSPNNTTSSSTSCTQQDAIRMNKSESSPDIPTTLEDTRRNLENDLLHVTKQLYHKYQKQVYPDVPSKSSTYQSLHKKWTQDQLNEAEKYTTYMKGRYATRNDLEFFKKSLPEKDNSNNFHRKHKQHTKYGDSLALAKHSLRGKF
ncbi:hypothetical protein THRCLA_00396 [Thraustotheca clavata]|uniref:Uncharacterized protein n=1 Tax=Thraustotheca clavata TaxID=74557 RepID=A0A1W0ABN8_9STRA|nr:hypothetical protein THRCLA_00396 [Thraustotheca clavata]